MLSTVQERPRLGTIKRVSKRGIGRLRQEQVGQEEGCEDRMLFRNCTADEQYQAPTFTFTLFEICSHNMSQRTFPFSKIRRQTLSLLCWAIDLLPASGLTETPHSYLLGGNSPEASQHSGFD